MKIITLFLICAIFIRCSPIYYVPNTQNVPVMKNKGQTNILLAVNSSESTDGTELQGAYGITDQIALQLNADWVKSSESSSYGSGKFIEFGPGYYKNLSDHVVFETYGLLGFGSLKYENSSYDTPQKINASFTRFGLQPSISFSSKYFNASLSSRIATLNYNSVSGNFYDVDYLKENDSYWLIEPALTVQGGFENIKLQIQFQYSNNQTNSNFSQDYTLFSLGLKITLNPKKE